eukprot:TRINITY_DN1849_c0_g1_i2.p1 TRINITY_DN1849_c0_g1~~TRINITY_DN1849_c0_g1_i2.p1  ORF type:complete len:502 (+),score=73.19 TRINITY_DN1849_c0_g1_i2:45-1550(+)
MGGNPKPILWIVLTVVCGILLMRYSLKSPSEVVTVTIQTRSITQKEQTTTEPPSMVYSTITNQPAVRYPTPKKYKDVTLSDGKKVVFSSFPQTTCDRMRGHQLAKKKSIAAALDSCARWPVCQSVQCTSSKACLLYSPSCVLENNQLNGSVTFVIEERTAPKLNFGPLDISKKSFGTNATNSATEKTISREECTIEASRSVWENIPMRTSKKYPYTKVTWRDYISFATRTCAIPQHKIVFFRMPKVMSTNIIGLSDRMLGHRDLVLDLNQTTNLHGMISTPARPRMELRSLKFNEVDQIMNDPTWRKVLFLRDPVERLLSCYLDKFMKNGGENFGALYGRNRTPGSVTFPEFVSFVGSSAPAPYGVGPGTNAHFRSQVLVSNLFKFLPHFDQIGWGNSASAEHVLKRYGLWEQYSSKELWPFGFMRNGGSHPTGSSNKKDAYYTEELKEAARKAYDIDYAFLKRIGLENKEDMPVSGLSMMPLNSGCCDLGCVPISLGKDI